LSPEEARRRLAALGFAADDVEVLAGHFLAAEAAGRSGHGGRRIEWLESFAGLQPHARPEPDPVPAFSRLAAGVRLHGYRNRREA
jgi:LDH2 family malate/lactate/ureidoglycolate dehydrogenase